jgi:hypothetical protein
MGRQKPAIVETNFAEICFLTQKSFQNSDLPYIAPGLFPDTQNLSAL